MAAEKLRLDAEDAAQIQETERVLLARKLVKQKQTFRTLLAQKHADKKAELKSEEEWYI